MALEQHAIPTEVTSYEFRLVGDWTIKQFAWLAGGIIIAIFFWGASWLPDIIRLPAILIFATSGALIAFVPIQGRPLDRWLIAFVKAIYAPTEFLWQREQKIPAYFQSFSRPVAIDTGLKTNKTNIITSSDIAEYISTLNINNPINQADELEKQAVTSLNQYFTDSIPQTPNIPNIPSRASSYIEEIPNISPQLTPSLNLPILEEQLTDPSTNSTSNNSNPSILEMQIQDQIPTPTPVDYPINAPTLTPPPTINPTPIEENTSLSTNNLETTTNEVSIEPQTTSTEEVLPPPFTQSEQNTMANQLQPSNTSTVTPPINNPIKAEIDISSLLPPAPQIPNLLVGVVANDQGQPLTGVILEIKNQLNQPVRAIKTNQFGHFAIATPLPIGDYTITLDKDNYQFPTININSSGTIITPLSIIAQSIATNTNPYNN